MLGNLISFLGWIFLPDLCTGWFQRFLYSLTYRGGRAKPQSGTPKFNNHRRWIYLCAVLIYLFYTLYQAHYDIQQDGDFYRDLGIAYDVDERAINTRFRRLSGLAMLAIQAQNQSRTASNENRTLLHHPDKYSDKTAKLAAEAFFIKLHTAKETLLTPAKRFAYDRFGPEITEWQDVVTIKEYLRLGLTFRVPWYVGSAISVVLLDFFGMLGGGRFWRYLSLACLAMVELRLLTRPTLPFLSRLPSSVTDHLPSPLDRLTSQYLIPPAYLPFQILEFTRQALISLSLGFSRLQNTWETPMPGEPGYGEGITQQQKMDHSVQKLEQLAGANKQAALRAAALEIMPFQNDPEAMEELRGKIQDYLVTNVVRSDKEVQDAVLKVRQRRKAEKDGVADG
ncbi:MAG: hypothetical protein M1828_002922 [Chrysothrix sp. TS-e1954]|nr:MAG: hypothetical protein M1828_002922 [Chrysothrix sp. TS-e1954]